MEENISKILIQVATYSTFLPAALALSHLKSQLTIKRTLSWLVLISSIIALSSHIMGRYFSIPNLWLLHLLTIVEFIFFALIYRDVLGQRLATVVIWMFSLAAGLNSLYLFLIVKHWHSFNVYARTMESFLLMLFALTFFGKTLKEMKIKHLETHPLFWVSCGVLLYFSANFFIFIFSGDLYNLGGVPTWYEFWGLHAILTFLLNLFYAIALWVKPKG